MYQVVEQTDSEKFVMYNKLTKKELIMMLIEANKHLNSRPLTWVNEGFSNKCHNFIQNPITTGILCMNCGESKYNHK
jgi:hypothetical protein